MNSISKLQKHSKEDRISNLPDSILCHILSYLPTKFAVATAILSRRWKFLWASVSNLHLDDHNFYGNPREKLSFMNFVDRVLMIRDSQLNLDHFYLNCGGNCDSTRVSQWLCAATRKNVREIELCLNLRSPFQLPPGIFVCKTLAVLRLNWKIFIDLPENVCFPSLKVLHFYGIEFLHFESIEKILCGCPILEDLVIKNCKWVQGRVLNICGLALKNLVLHSLITVRGDCECKIVVDAPALEHLDIKDYISEDFLLKNLCSLVEANVDVSQQLERFITVGEYGNCVFELLKGVSNVNFLSLSRETMESLGEAYDCSLPTFHNLTWLELTVDGWAGWNFLPNLLANSPVLEVLVFSEGLIQQFHFQLGVFRFNWSPPEHVPSCLLLHLKVIEIRKFRGVADELNLVKYFLKNAKVLMKMSIDCSSLKEDVKIQKKLLKFPRGSTSCQLDLIL